MVYHLDPEILEALKPLAAHFAGRPALAAGDVTGRRARVVELMEMNAGAVLGSFGADAPKLPEDVSTRDFYVQAADGYQILARWYTKDGARAAAGPGPAVLNCHGGGMFMMSIDSFHSFTVEQVSATGVPVLTIEYRLAPEHPHPTPVEDCYAGLVWLQQHAQELNVDPARIALKGESGGGGIAAGVALMARDRRLEPRVAAQLLVYPMLDDRNTKVDENLKPFATWNYNDNATGWGALLGNDVGTDRVSPYAAPARAGDLSNLPRTFIDVGQLDIFVREDVEYAMRISDAGGDVEFHLYPGAPHGFDGRAPYAEVTKRAWAERYRFLRKL